MMEHFIFFFFLPNLQFMFLFVHVEIALLLLFIFTPHWLDGVWEGLSWSGKEQRGVFINVIVSSSEQHKTQKTTQGLLHTMGFLYLTHHFASVTLTYNSSVFQTCKPLHGPDSINDSAPSLQLTGGFVWGWEVPIFRQPILCRRNTQQRTFLSIH